MKEILEFFTELRETFPLFFEYMANSFIMAFGSLGIVYFLGRMMNIAKSDKARNIIASIIMLGIGVLFSLEKYGPDYTFDRDVVYFILDNIFYFSGACIVYVNLCFKLFSRIDSLLDKKIGEDKEEKKSIKKKKEKNK